MTRPQETGRIVEALLRTASVLFSPRIRSFFSKEKTNQVACSPSELHIRMTRMVRARIRATLPASNFDLISNRGENRYIGNVGENVPICFSAHRDLRFRGRPDRSQNRRYGRE